MRLYLVQHGEAKSEKEDPSRPLTENGRDEVEKIARFLMKVGVSVKVIYHSGKLRAAQTAEILALHLKPLRGVEKAEALEPLADPRIWAEKIREIDEEIMLVGHLPHLKKLASLLLVGEESLEIVKFRYGGVLCLERSKEDVWSIVWIVRPDIISSEGSSAIV